MGRSGFSNCDQGAGLRIFFNGGSSAVYRKTMMRRFIECIHGVTGLTLVVWLGLLSVGAQGAWSQVRTRGAEITTSRIVVDEASHWSHWSLPTHAVDLVDDRVEFHYFRDRFNVVEDHTTYQRDIPALDFRDKFKNRKGEPAVRSVRTVGLRFTYDDQGKLRLRSDRKMEKYLDTHYLRYPGSETHVVFNGELYAITDTTMTSTKEGDLTLKNVETGAVSTRAFKTKDKNPVPVYEYFTRMGISRVGSNPPAEGALFDGVGSTYWEPAAEDPIGNWWIEVDLGRSVLVDQIVLKFVPEERGDPFRQFKVSILPWQEPMIEEFAEAQAFGTVTFLAGDQQLGLTVKTGLTVVGGTRSANEDQRQFTIDLEPPADAEPAWTGRMVQTIRIVVFDTKGGRHTRLSPQDQAAAQWQALAPADQGDIVYFVRSQEGFEQPVTEEAYAQLPQQRQGRRDYYRRERPRLADIEVWGLGDNLSPAIAAGGGRFQVDGEGIAAAGTMFDGDYRTIYRQAASTAARFWGLLTVDLGATFWLDEVRTIAANVPTDWSKDYFEGYIHRYSDGTQDPTGRLKFERLSPFEREDITSFDVISLNRAARDSQGGPSGGHYYQLKDEYTWAPKVRFLQTRILGHSFSAASGGAFIREHHLYTHAYPAEVVLESDILVIPLVQNFGRIFWDARTPPGTRLEVRTRSGDRIGKIVNYYHKSGEFWGNDEQVWEGLGPSKGGTDTTYVPTASAWSLWSNPYLSSGAWATSPGGRRFMQVQVKMITEDREVAPTLHGLEIELVPPVGERIVAEVRPERVAAPGVVDTFEVFILPNFIEGRGSGFDEILLEMSSVGMELLDLGLGVDAETGTAAQLFRAAGGFVDENGEALEVLRRAGDSLWVRLSEVQNILPDALREYRRLTVEGDQVPIDAEGFALTAAAWGLLEAAEQGAVRYFRQRQAGDDMQLTEVADQAAYEDLEPSEQGPIRYFRILQGAGESVPFDTDGDSLTASTYRRLGTAEKGPVVGAGELLRLRYAAPVFRNGTTVEVAVRNSDGGRDLEQPWQSVEAGDATPMVASNTLSIGLPLGAVVLDQVELSPNPFTPNGDGVNDAVRIGFSVFKISAAREMKVSVYTLDGRRVWETAQMIDSGRESVHWTGVDAAGARVPPGMYLCKVALDVDSEDQGGTTIARVVAVAY